MARFSLGAEFGLSGYRDVPEGWEATFKSAGMQAELARIASRLRGKADESAHLHRTDKKPRYSSEVAVIKHTAVGRVNTGNRLSEIDEANHHTLESLNH